MTLGSLVLTNRKVTKSVCPLVEDCKNNFSYNWNIIYGSFGERLLIVFLNCYGKISYR